MTGMSFTVYVYIFIEVYARVGDASMALLGDFWSHSGVRNLKNRNLTAS